MVVYLWAKEHITMDSLTVDEPDVIVLQFGDFGVWEGWDGVVISANVDFDHIQLPISARDKIVQIIKSAIDDLAREREL
jgi:hypothetical protein